MEEVGERQPLLNHLGDQGGENHAERAETVDPPGRFPLPRSRFQRLAAASLLATDDVHVDPPAPANQTVHDRAVTEFLPPGSQGLADDDFGDVSGLGVADEVLGRTMPGNAHGFAAKLLGQPEGPADPVLVGSESRSWAGVSI